VTEETQAEIQERAQALRPFWNEVGRAEGLLSRLVECERPDWKQRAALCREAGRCAMAAAKLADEQAEEGG
jgi:hypothetical protein